MIEPKWMKVLKEKFFDGISNVFLLTGNIGDYAIPGIPLIDYIVDELTGDMDITDVATINYSKGTRWKKKFVVEEDEQFGSDMEQDWFEMLDMLTKLHAENQNGVEVERNFAYIVEYPEFLIGKSENGYVDEMTKKRLIDLHQVMNDRIFLTSKHILILVTEAKSSIHDLFLSANSRTTPIVIDYPSETELLDMIRYLKAPTGDAQPKKIDWEIDEKQFAKLTAGLSRIHVEDLYLQAEKKGKLEKRMVMDRKKDLIRKEYGEVIEIFDVEGRSFEQFAGQEHIKAYHREAVIQPMLEGDYEAVPKGILYVGPPGTGKTFLAGCVGGEAQVNCVEFKMSKILAKYVGEAERNLEKAFACFRALAPVIVFIDELDQALSRGSDSDGNSVNKNMFGMFLPMLSDPSTRGRILWIGATNYPNKIDEALKRAGRFDKKIPFLPPNEEERKEVFKVHLNKAGIPSAVKDFDTLAKKTVNYTPAEIENIIVKALEVAKRKKLSQITDETISYAMEMIISVQNTRIQEMVDLALDECNDIEFLPPEYREKVKEKRQTS